MSEEPKQEPFARPTSLWRRILIGTILVVVALLAAFVVWGLTPLGPSDTALVALQSGSWVKVAETSYGWRFQPVGTVPSTGLVIYPGGHVDARSYAPLAREIASRGHTVALVTVPLSLAVLNPSAADAPLEQESSVKTWAVGGHSLGGVMAADYAKKHPGQVRGLLLLASYPADTADLRASSLAAASLYGDRDGVLDLAAWQAAKPLLPPDTDIVRIAGGNHSQFGSYGLQPKDNPATITEDEQVELTANAAQIMFDRAQGSSPE